MSIGSRLDISAACKDSFELLLVVEEHAVAEHSVVVVG